MENTNIAQSSSYFNNAIDLVMSTALRLIDLNNKEPDEKKTTKPRLKRRVSGLNLDTLPEIPLDQVLWHDNCDDCWIVLYDRVYDITEFIQQHPGGMDVLLEYAGRDATLAYRGFGHSAQAWKILQKYLIGVLPENERTGIFKEEEKFLGTNIELRAVTS